jgi:23S rRNA (guanosine2251-2'-O)-methyltransferase
VAEYIAGRNAVVEALRAGQRVRKVFVDGSLRESDSDLRDVLAAASTANVKIERIPRARLDQIHRRHQGFAAEVEPFRYTSYADFRERIRSDGEHALVLVLDEVQDPQNLASLLRTGLATRVSGVLIPDRRAVGITPVVSRVSAGAAEHLAITQVPNLARALDELKRDRLWVVGLDAHGGTPYDEADLRGPLALVVGSEGSGLRRLVREHCDLLIHLPMSGPTESLNAAIAGSIALYHIFRLRARPGAGAR